MPVIGGEKLPSGIFLGLGLEREIRGAVCGFLFTKIM